MARWRGLRLRRAIGCFERMPAGLIRIVVAHHPLLPPEAEPEGMVVGGARAALAAFGAHGVRLVLSGHLHRSYARLAAPDAAGPLILQGGSATSTRLRGEANAFNRIEVRGDGVAVIEGMVWAGGGWEVGGRREVGL